MKFLLVAVAILFSITTAPAFAGTYEGADKAYDAGDYEKAKSIALPLAKAGNAKAMNLIGLMHDFGYGFPKDSSLGCNWYEKAAKLGYARAQNNLSICYKNGEGRAVDVEQAIFWAEKAANQGLLDAQEDLMRIYEKRGNIEQAKKWGQIANSRGSAIARIYMDAAGIQHSGPKATVIDYACVGIMIEILGKPGDYCDWN